LWAEGTGVVEAMGKIAGVVVVGKGVLAEAMNTVVVVGSIVRVGALARPSKGCLDVCEMDQRLMLMLWGIAVRCSA
jgi:hypothetical protein